MIILKSCKLLFLSFLVFTAFLCTAQEDLNKKLIEETQKNNLPGIKELIAKGADINTVDENNASVIMWAVFINKTGLVKYLVENGATLETNGVIYLDTTKVSYFGSLTGMAASANNKDLLKYLIEDCKIPVDDKEYFPSTGIKNGWTALQWAAYSGSDDCIEYLLMQGADINTCHTDDKGTPLYFSLLGQKPETALLLISKGADINIKDANDWLPLHFACRMGYMDVAKILILATKDLNVKTKNGYTPLILAAYNNQYELCEMLVNCGADIAIKAGDGKTAIDIANEYGFKDVAGYLQNPDTYKRSLNWQYYNDMFLREYRAGNYKKSVEYGEKTKEMVKQEFGENDQNYLVAINNLIGAYQSAGYYDKVEPLCMESLKLQKVILGEDHPEYGGSLNAIAMFFKQMGDSALTAKESVDHYNKAVNMFMEYKSFMKKQYGDNEDYARFANDMGMKFRDMSKYQKAAELFSEARELYEKLNGKKNDNYLVSSYNLACTYFDLKKYDQALPVFLEVYKTKKEIFSNDNEEYLSSLYDLAITYKEMYDFRNSEPLLIEMKDAYLKKYGEMNIETAWAINELAVLYFDFGHIDEAEPLMEQALKIRKELMGDSHPHYAISLCNLASVYEKKGQYDKAEKLLTESVTVLGNSTGEKNRSYIYTIQTLGKLYANTGMYKKAEELFSRSLELTAELSGKETEEYADALNFLAELYRNIQDFKKAEPLYIEAIDICKRVKGKKNYDYATFINNLGLLYSETGKLKQAVSLISESSDVILTIFGENTLEYSRTRNNLGMCYQRVCNFSEAEKCYNESKKIAEELHGEIHPDYARALNNLGSLFAETGYYDKAEQYHFRAKDILERTSGKIHINYARSVDHISDLYKKMGNYNSALDYGTEAKDIRKQLFGEEHIEYATSLNNMALLLKRMGRDAEAEDYYLKCLDITKEALGIEHQQYLLTLNNLASLYGEKKEYEKAEKMLVESITVLKKTIGEDHRDYAILLGNLGLIYLYMAGDEKFEDTRKGYLEKAEDMFLKAKKIITETLGKKHPTYTIALKNLAMLYEEMGKNDRSEIFYREALDNVYWQIEQNFAFLSEKEKENFIYTLEDYFRSFNAFVLERQVENPAITEYSYNNALNKKGLLLKSGNRMRNVILSSGDKDLIDIYNKWTGAKKELSLLYSKPVSERDTDPEVLIKEANELEKELVRKSAEMAGLKDLLSVTWNDVKENLGDDEAAIEFVRIVTLSEDTIYSALVLRKKDKYPQMVKLFEEKQIREVFTGLKSNNYEYVNNIYGSRVKPVTSVYDLVWEPFDKLLEGINTVYISPAGMLYKISFAALATSDTTKPFLSDRYNINVVSTTGRLALKGTGFYDFSDITANIYGGINYNSGKTTMEVWKFLK